MDDSKMLIETVLALRDMVSEFESYGLPGPRAAAVLKAKRVLAMNSHVATQGKPKTNEAARTFSSPYDEKEFQIWFAHIAERLGMDPDPDSTLHCTDIRACYLAGEGPDQHGHWPERFDTEEMRQFRITRRAELAAIESSRITTEPPTK